MDELLLALLRDPNDRVDISRLPAGSLHVRWAGYREGRRHTLARRLPDHPDERLTVTLETMLAELRREGLLT